MASREMARNGQTSAHGSLGIRRDDADAGAGRLVDDDGVAGRKCCEEARVGVPGGEGRATDDHGHASAHDLKALFHDQRGVLALGLFPGGLGGDKALLAVGVRHGLKAAILRMRGASLESHHPALAGRHHHRVRKLEALAVQPLEDLDTNAGAAFATKSLPGCHGLLACTDERGNIAYGVLDIKRYAVGGSLAAQPASLPGLIQAELFAEVGLKGALAVVGGRFAVHLGAGHLAVGGPVATRTNCLERRFQLGAMLLK